MMSDKPRCVKPLALFLGKRGLGKESLIKSLIRETREEDVDYISYRIFDRLEEEKCEMTLALQKWDLDGCRHLSEAMQMYPEMVAVGLCFAVDDPTSLREITRYHVEVQKHLPRMPVFLVGTKVDQRYLDYGPVSHEQGLAVAQTINAAIYYECSSKTGEMINQLKISLIKLITNNWIVGRP